MNIAVQLPAAATAAERGLIEHRLNEAVAIVRTAAMQDGLHGILVTRHNFDSFTVSLSEDVPFGLTREHDAW